MPDQRSRRPRRPARGGLAALAVAGCVLLTGCGLVRPGTAVQVGSETISSRQVDAAAKDICTLSKEQLESSGQAVPMSLMRGQAVQLLTVAAVARQLAAEYDVTPGPEYRTQLTRLEQTAQSLPSPTRDTYVELSAAAPYATAVIDEVGRVSLEADGVQDPSSADREARGRALFRTWSDRHDLRIDPLYGVHMVDGRIVPAATDTSFPLSPTAVAGQAEQVDQAAAAALPAAQRCG